jgi:hypothetical protein
MQCLRREGGEFEPPVGALKRSELGLAADRTRRKSVKKRNFDR